jgi:hypothetical protein
VKTYVLYGRKASWIVKIYGKYGNKAGRIVIRYGHIEERQVEYWNDNENMEEK